MCDRGWMNIYMNESRGLPVAPYRWSGCLSYAPSACVSSLHTTKTLKLALTKLINENLSLKHDLEDYLVVEDVSTWSWREQCLAVAVQK